MKRTGTARSNTATKASAKRQTVFPIAQKSSESAQAKQATSVSSPFLPKSKSEVSQIQSSVT